MIPKPKHGRRNGRYSDHPLDGMPRAGGHRVGFWHPKAVADDETVEIARMLRDGGMTYVQIAEQVGAPPRTIADWVNYRTRP